MFFGIFNGRRGSGQVVRFSGSMRIVVYCIVTVGNFVIDFRINFYRLLFIATY